MADEPHAENAMGGERVSHPVKEIKYAETGKKSSDFLKPGSGEYPSPRRGQLKSRIYPHGILLSGSLRLSRRVSLRDRVCEQTLRRPIEPTTLTRSDPSPESKSKLAPSPLKRVVRGRGVFRSDSRLFQVGAKYSFAGDPASRLSLMTLCQNSAVVHGPDKPTLRKPRIYPADLCRETLKGEKNSATLRRTSARATVSWMPQKSTSRLVLWL
jgi:hypothetical protein